MAAIHLRAHHLFIIMKEEACIKDAGNGFLSDETLGCAIEHETYLCNG